MKLKDEYSLIVPFSFGGVLVRANRKCILESAFVRSRDIKKSNALNMGKEAEVPLLREAKKQLNDYFKGNFRDLCLPLDESVGTAFQRSVWLSLQKIPFGETRSYQDIALAVKSPKGSQAVGTANSKNPFALFVPCHRVINKNGNLGGFGAGKRLKKWLLHFEGVKI
tara:strand:+ start:2262 stop:2762 length:501 start_codon:yes stop_codon:yes gene_type:complete